MQKTCQKNIDKIRLNLYSVHGSLVERQLPIWRCACSSPGKSIIFKLGLSLFAENAPKLLQKIRQNMNVRVLANRT
jgi:hypothetical protein